MHACKDLIDILKKDLNLNFVTCDCNNDSNNIELNKCNLLKCFNRLKNIYNFEQLIDIIGVDYLHYGKDQWQTESSTEQGFSRGVHQDEYLSKNHSHTSRPRFAVIYHLLCLSSNIRLRIKVYLDENDLFIPTVTNIWPSANWHEREAFDMFGIKFQGHPDLRRILTDYGFNGHPFRKDFPQHGYVEMRYDETLDQVVYEPIEIDPRIISPKIIRKDNRYLSSDEL